MSTLKGILFQQVAGEALAQLVEELQQKFKPKKGRRFNNSNITYEISRPALKNNALEFEISSKIPQDELKSEKEMKTYFQEIKKRLESGDKKPLSIEMENIVWDSKKDSEKQRDYVKLLYSYPLDDLFDNNEVVSRYEKIRAGGSKEAPPPASGAMTFPGNLVLDQVRTKIHDHGLFHIEQLMDSNKAIRDRLTKKR